MQTLKKNVSILISYTGTLENGEIFEEVSSDTPLNLTLGDGTLFPALESALVGMLPGENRTIQIPAEYAYGPYREDLVQSINRSVFGDRITPRPGMILALTLNTKDTEEKVPATVLSVNEYFVVVDYNHPLAGKNLTYSVTLEDIKEKE